jgi:dihydroorotate dehydrogenase (fumarate)
MECVVGRHTFKNRLIFGGGTCKTIEDVKKACTTDIGGIEIGTITPQAKQGNPGPNNFQASWKNGVLLYTLNSLGLPNPGKEYWTRNAREAISYAHNRGIRIGINIAADSVEEIIQMVIWGLDLGFDWVTISGGCPNKFSAAGKPLGTLTFDIDAIAHLINALEVRVGAGASEVWWKPSPHTDTVGALVDHGIQIARSTVITSYIANNTVPQAFMWNEDGQQAISAGDGLAGMGGPAVKPIALGHLRILDKILPPRIFLQGSGGVVHGDDMADHQKSGAQLIHITSWVWVNNMNYGVVNPLLAEYLEHPFFDELN